MKHEIPARPAWVEPLEAYLSWMRAAHRSPGTIYQHSYALRRFAASTGLDPWPVTLAQLATYMASLDGRSLGAAARRTPRQALRGFYAWGQLAGRWAENPALHLPTIRATRGVPRAAPEHAVRVGRRNADERSRLMLELAVNAGLRCCEIALVQSRDLIPDLVGWSLIVYGKGDKQRSVPVDDDIAGRLRAWFAERGEGYAFEGRIDGHLSASRVSELISDVLPPGVTAHMLRHRFGTRAYQNGGRDIRAVQELLGHAYVSTTQVYTAVEDSAKRRAALAAAS
jgi:site-specific recombinase XerC